VGLPASIWVGLPASIWAGSLTTRLTTEGWKLAAGGRQLFRKTNPISIGQKPQNYVKIAKIAESRI